MKNFVKNWGVRWKKRAAESLVEVILALFVVVVGSGAATSLIIAALRSNQFSKDNLIALNLAVEAIEGVRSGRDTSWLRSGFNKEDCWNAFDPPACTIHLPAGYYPLYVNPNDYTFSSSASNPPTFPLDLETGAAAENEKYRLGWVDLDDSVDSNNDGDFENDPDFYVLNTEIAGLGLPNAGESKFYRMVEISYPDTFDPATAEVMDVRVLVQWEQNGVSEVELFTTLTNYQKDL